MNTPLLHLPPLDPLRGFVAAARALSFTRAAEVLCLTQSAVSRQVQALEEGLGVSLFVRGTRTLTLTPEGVSFYERCRQIVLDLEDAEQSLSSVHLAPRGRLRLTMPVSVGRLQVAGLVPEFLARYPEVTIDASATDRLVDLIEEGFDQGFQMGVGLNSGEVMSGQVGSERRLEYAAIGRRTETQAHTVWCIA